MRLELGFEGCFKNFPGVKCWGRAVQEKEMQSRRHKDLLQGAIMQQNKKNKANIKIKCVLSAV